MADDKEKHSNEIKYFTSILGGGDSHLSRTIESANQILLAVLLLECTKRWAKEDGVSVKEIRSRIFDFVFNTMKQQADEGVKKHTEMCQTGLGPIFAGLIGDGEAMRLKLHKSLTEARKMFAILEGMPDDDFLEESGDEK